ncbi:MAG: hypothetical protein J6M47_07640 [Clostridia bacterium]|nr:hypothetical protein [Clostridia bacterium]
MKKRGLLIAMLLLACLAAVGMRTEETRIRLVYYEPQVRRLPDELRNGPVAAPYETRGEMNIYGESAVYQDARGRIHIVSKEGHDTAYDDIIGVFCLPHTDGRLYAVENTDFLVGLYDSRGTQLLEEAYAGFEASEDGKTVTAYGDYGGVWEYEVFYE